jgi:CheY-like chemotaxis protein
MERRTILVVDDSDSVCAAIAAYLEISGYAALTAHDGVEGVKTAKQHLPDMILLDIMMPRLDGWGAIEQLRTDPQTRGIPVVALTALRLPQDQLDKAGFEGYLSKPVAPHRLADELGRLCGRA